MSAINSVNDRMLSLSTPNIEQQNRVSQVQNNQRQIAHIDREIDIRTDYRNTLVESRDAHIESRDAWKNYANLLEQNIAGNNELISLYKESRELDKKRIVLLTESKEILQNTNDKLQALLDRGQGRKTVSAELRLQKRSVELNDLDRKLTYLSKQEAVVKKQTTLVDAKVDKLAMKVDYTEKQLAKIESKVNNTVSDTSSVISNSSVGLSSTYVPTENQIKNKSLQERVDRTIKADGFLISGEYDKAQKEYDKIIIKYSSNNKATVDKDYRPLDEQLRLASKTYMAVVDFQNYYKLDITSKSELVASIIASHIIDKNSVSKAEALNMIQNQFFYSERSNQITLVSNVLNDKSNIPKTKLLNINDTKVDHTEKQLVKLEAKINNAGFTTPQEKAVSERDTPGILPTYKPFTSYRFDTYAEDEVTKEKSVADLKALEKKVYNSQKNIYESIVSKMLAKLV